MQAKCFRSSPAPAVPTPRKKCTNNFSESLQLDSNAGSKVGEDSLESILVALEKEFMGSTHHSAYFMQEIRKIAQAFEDTKVQQPDEDEPFKSVRTSISNPGNTRAERMDPQRPVDKKVSAGSDKVVYTSTTTEHTTNEDGIVETSVTFHKRFADGRETVTTTTHMEDLARDEKGDSMERYTADRTGGDRQQR